MKYLGDFPYLYSKDFKLSKPLTDEELQDVCTTIKKRMEGLTSESPRVSVVFPAYNEEMYLPLMLWTLSKLLTTIPIEIIGVNNTSTDRTGEIIEQSGVTRIDEPRKGVSYARQAGLEGARGDIVATTDADTQVPETWIDENMQQFSNDQNLVCFSSGVKFTQPHFSYYVGRYVYLLIKEIMSGKSGDIISIQSWPGANTFYDRSSALIVGGYELGSDIGEDNKLARSMQSYGKVRRLDYFCSDSTVISSSRRLGSFQKVIKHSYDRLTRLGFDYSKIPSGMTFTDIR